MAEASLYGLMAEFEQAEELLEAAKHAHQVGYRNMEAYSPFHVEGLDEAIKPHHKEWIPPIMLAGGILGGAGAYFMQYYAAVLHYPLNIGGRPYHSWPMFIPITFEMTVLGSALIGVVAMLVLNGLPLPYHPVFNEPRFRRASRDRFFLCIEATDKKFDTGETRKFLEGLKAASVFEVEP